MNHAPVAFAMPEDWRFTERLAAHAGVELGSVSMREFPDGETYLRLLSGVRDREAIVVCSLRHPNERCLPLLFLADAARQLGARRVGIVAPYLAYMRQDARFHEGEAITARSFASLVARSFDWLITVDPHLHRIHELRDIYAIPATAVHAAAAIGHWIARSAQLPLIIGPDEESTQWASEVAGAADAPWVVLSKTRRGDRDVEIALPDMASFADRTPVLVDDIVSSGETMASVVRHLRRCGMRPPVCVAVHAVLAAGAQNALIAAGASAVVTTNTIAHTTNGIDIIPMLSEALREQLVDR